MCRVSEKADSIFVVDRSSHVVMYRQLKWLSPLVVMLASRCFVVGKVHLYVKNLDDGLVYVIFEVCKHCLS